MWYDSDRELSATKIFQIKLISYPRILPIINYLQDCLDKA